MADPRTAHTDRMERQDRPERSAGAVIAVIVGVIGAIVSFVPGLFWAAWILGAIAIGVSLPALKQGPTAPSHGLARVAAGAGALALVVGLINLGITLDWFDYFNPD